MTQIFLHIVNMSITASYVILAVILFRLIIRKAPKWISVALWGIAAFRLVCPFSIESVFSLIPNARPISPSIMMEDSPQINTGIPILNNTLNPVMDEFLAPNIGDSVNPLQILIPIFTIVWIVGMLALTIYAVVSYVKVRRNIGTAVLYKDNIYQSENVASPFVLGIVKPKIYISFDMNENDMGYVWAHEQAHIKRRDYIWKPLGFILLTIYWFNPLVWLCYVLLCRDIELACDEKVIEKLDQEARADYSKALLDCSVDRRMIAACPIAFGEVSVKDRVKSILSYKKPAFWIIIVALVACVTVVVCFLTNPKGDYGETDPDNLTEEQIALMEMYPEYFGLDASQGLNVYVCQMAPQGYYFGISQRDVYDTPGKGVRADQMRLILDTYDVPIEDIRIVPWYNMLSSYMPHYQITYEGEDVDAKNSAFVQNIRKMLSEEKTYGDEDPSVELVYSHPLYSYVDSYYSGIKIVGNTIYDLNSGEEIGTLWNRSLNRLEFDVKIKKGLGSEIQSKTFLSYEVTHSGTEKDIDLYFVIVQNDGTVLLVYGQYIDGVREGTIRWIYNIGK